MGVMIIRIDNSKRKALKIIASIEGKSMGGIVSELIEEYIKLNKVKIRELSDNENLKKIMNLTVNSLWNGIMTRTKYIMNYEIFDIILVPFPFTDSSSSKRRPALIISPKEYNLGKDVIIAFITSNLSVESRIGDYEIIEW